MGLLASLLKFRLVEYLPSTRYFPFPDLLQGLGSLPQNLGEISRLLSDPDQGLVVGMNVPRAGA